MGGMPRAVRARWQRLPDRLDGTTVGWRGFAFVAHAEGEAGGTLRLWRMRKGRLAGTCVCGACGRPRSTNMGHLRRKITFVVHAMRHKRHFPSERHEKCATTATSRQRDAGNVPQPQLLVSAMRETCHKRPSSLIACADAAALSILAHLQIASTQNSSVDTTGCGGIMFRLHRGITSAG